MKAKKHKPKNEFRTLVSFKVCNPFCRWRFGDERISKTACIYLLLIVGVISSVLLVFLWDETATIGGVGEYREVQLDLTPEIEIFYMPFIDVMLKIERDLSNSI